MSVTIRQGSPQFPAVTGSIPSSTHETMDAAVQTLQEHKDAWVALSNRERIAILDNLINNFAAIAQLWIAASLQAKGIAGDSPGVGEEWVAGVWPVLKNLRQLRNSLSDIETYGRPRIPGPVTTRPDGQVVAQVFPQTTYPGAHNRYQAFVSAHPEAEQCGTTTEKELPWTLIAGVNPDATDDLCFTTEA